MNLLYVTIKAILNPHIEDRLVRCIYELRTMVIQGVMPQLFQCAGCGRELTEEETGELFFSQDEHGILCADCKTMAMDRKRDLSGCPVCYALHSRVPLSKTVYVYCAG